MVTRLRAAVIPSGLVLAGQPLFEQVEVYDLTDIADAFEKLLLTGERVAVVVLESVPAKVERSGTNMVTTIRFDIAVMFTDRSLTRREDAMMGGDSNPGCLNLIPSVIEACSGDYDGSVCMAGNEAGRLLVLTGSDAGNNFDRVCYRQPFVATGGNLRQIVARGAQP